VLFQLVRHMASLVLDWCTQLSNPVSAGGIWCSQWSPLAAVSPTKNDIMINGTAWCVGPALPLGLCHKRHVLHCCVLFWCLQPTALCHCSTVQGGGCCLLFDVCLGSSMVWQWVREPATASPWGCCLPAASRAAKCPVSEQHQSSWLMGFLVLKHAGKAW